MLSVPGAKTVRGYSFFGDSFVYVLFEDGTDMYWARSRVLEYLNQVQSKLPPGAKASLGPDATGVGWIYQYSLVDRSGTQDAGQLRALQDWFLKFELKTVQDVSEVASIGGMVKQYQVVLDPVKLAGYGITHAQAVAAIGPNDVRLVEVTPWATPPVRAQDLWRALDAEAASGRGELQAHPRSTIPCVVAVQPLLGARPRDIGVQGLRLLHALALSGSQRTREYEESQAPGPVSGLFGGLWSGRRGSPRQDADAAE